MKFGMDRPRARDHTRCAREKEEQKGHIVARVKNLNNATLAHSLFNSKHTIKTINTDKSVTLAIIRLAYSFACIL